MTERFKIAYIGAGSFRFSTVFFRDIARAAGSELPPVEVGLCDIDEKSLKINEIYFRRIARKAKRKIGADIRIQASVNRRDVLENADFVYKSISVGIQESEFFDIYLPLKFGIPQNTGDTVGPGGLFRALRTNAVSAAIAEDIKELCPKAPILSYTNPQATIVLAARRVAPDIQFIGLCHELFGGLKTLHKWATKFHDFNIPNWEDLEVEYGGVNHFAWFTKLEYNGQDLYPVLQQDARKLVLKKFSRPFNFYLLDKHSYFPYPGSRHVAEFIPEYYNYFNHVIQCPYWHFPKIRNVIGLAKLRRIAYALIKAVNRGLFWVPGPAHSGEKAMDMTIDWWKKRENVYVVNIPNTHPDYNKIIPELPDECIVEVPAFFKNGKIMPVKTIHLPRNIADLVRPHAEQQKLTVDAALGDSLDLVIKAMLHDPMCAWIEDDDRIEYLTKIMLYHERKWMPEKWRSWIPKKDELQESKWWVSEKDLSLKNKNYLKKKFPVDQRLKSKAFFWKDLA
ncbi:MAG: family 4 glycosyl hydrolase [Promethearchaeota archaeon]